MFVHKTFICFVALTMTKESFYDLGDHDAVQRHIKIERDKAKILRKSSWWKTQIQKGLCHFCQQSVGADNITMDHLVPLARGGKSTRGNIVPACQACNKKKQLDTPVESFLDQLKGKNDHQDSD
jgi:5-methylcytosine-specific restriction endonuclease McrA